MLNFHLNYLFFCRWLIVENFVPVDVFDTLRERCQYDADEDKWTIMKPGDSTTHSQETNIQMLTLHDTPNKQMLDSGLGAVATSSSDVSSTSGADAANGKTTGKLFAKRPVSFKLVF